jgi:succinate dehydrogenase hydrophobic anchor subunit
VVAVSGPTAPPTEVALPAAATGDGAIGETERDEPRAYAWIFVRLSGVLLVGLAIVQVADRYLVDDVAQVTALSMATRWQSVWWRLADFAFVVLATGHALVGLHWAARRRWGDGPARLVADAVSAVVLGTLGLLAAWSVLTVAS